MSETAIEEAKLPRLTRPQVDRLAEIGSKFPKGLAHNGKSATTAKLEALGCIHRAGGHPCEVWGATPIELSLAPLGMQILAGFPGDEFGPFRAALKQENVNG